MPDSLYRKFLESLNELPTEVIDEMVINLEKDLMDVDEYVPYSDWDFMTRFTEFNIFAEEMGRAYKDWEMPKEEQEEFYKWSDEVAKRAIKIGSDFYDRERGEGTWRDYIQELQDIQDNPYMR